MNRSIGPDLFGLHWVLVYGIDKEFVYFMNPFGYMDQLSHDEW